MVNNRFGYDLILETHNLLIPKRAVSNYRDLNWLERRELRKIIDTYSQEHYDLVFENSAKLRTVPELYHVHCGKYYPRDAVELVLHKTQTTSK
jgi:hypothetical protein